jgi:hypothetical protein
VAMGRGGPEQPEVAESPPSLEELLALSREGIHAASDYLEIAAIAGVVSIGCRRCGGGLAGAVTTSNVQAGAELALQRAADFVVFDGSGAAIPPVATAKRVLVTSAFDSPELVTGYLNAYRILLADLVVVTMADATTPHEALAEAVREVKPEADVIAVGFRPRPLAPIAGKRVAYFTTAAPSAHGRLAATWPSTGPRSSTSPGTSPTGRRWRGSWRRSTPMSMRRRSRPPVSTLSPRPARSEASTSCSSPTILFPAQGSPRSIRRCWPSPKRLARSRSDHD